MNIAYPFQFDKRGRTASATDPDHVRDMIEQLLFTAPGERVNRPDFGSGLRQMVFAPNRIEVAATLQFTLKAALQRWLGDVLVVEGLEEARTLAGRSPTPTLAIVDSQSVKSAEKGGRTLIRLDMTQARKLRARNVTPRSIRKAS